MTTSSQIMDQIKIELEHKLHDACQNDPIAAIRLAQEIRRDPNLLRSLAKEKRPLSVDEPVERE